MGRTQTCGLVAIFVVMNPLDTRYMRIEYFLIQSGWFGQVHALAKKHSVLYELVKKKMKKGN